MLAVVALAETAGPIRYRPPGMQYSTRHLTIAAAVVSGLRLASAGRRDAIPDRPAPPRRPRALGTGTWAWYGLPLRVLSPPWPVRAAALTPPSCCAGPAATRSRSCGMPVRAGAIRRCLMPNVPLPCEPVRHPIPHSDQEAWDLTGCLSIPKLPTRPGGSGWAGSPCPLRAVPCPPADSR
jgi:hypothetical protein